jgi:rSAM-associated Gly-rich repeat protein
LLKFSVSLFKKVFTMDFKTQVSFVGFLLAVSTLNVSTVNATTQSPLPETNTLSIENRLSRISKAIQERNIQDSETTQPQELPYLISGFGNARGGGGFANRAGGGGFGNVGGGGGFVNAGGGGGFLNNRWSDGGSFFNRF